MTNTRRGRLLCLLLALCLMLLPGCARGESEAETLSVTFFDAGKADAILVRTGEHALLIDTGLNKNGAALVDALRAAGEERAAGGKHAGGGAAGAGTGPHAG